MLKSYGTPRCYLTSGHFSFRPIRYLGTSLKLRLVILRTSNTDLDQGFHSSLGVQYYIESRVIRIHPTLISFQPRGLNCVLWILWPKVHRPIYSHDQEPPTKPYMIVLFYMPWRGRLVKFGASNLLYWIKGKEFFPKEWCVRIAVLEISGES